MRSAPIWRTSKDVRIYNPSAGLQEYYDQRASVLNRHIDAVRKASPAAADTKVSDDEALEQSRKARGARPKVEAKEDGKKAE